MVAKPHEQDEAPDRPAKGLKAPGYTVAELATRLRVSPDKIRAWIKAGRLGAINTADPTARKPRFVVLPDQLAAFIRSRTVSAPPPKPTRKPHLRVVKDFYP